MKYLKLYIVLLFVSFTVVSNAQDDEAYYDSLLTGSVENLNPVYKPVIGVGVGVMNFYGEVHNNYRNTVFGTPSYKVNIATFFDKSHYFKTNFTLMLGSVSGESRSLTDTSRNLNFKSNITAFGINVHYDFKHLIKNSRLRPFVSLGIENLIFDSKTDIHDKNGNYYHYWKDGTIRDVDETLGVPGNILQRDYVYDKNLSTWDRYGLTNYSQSTFSIPFEIGLDYSITDRINFRIAHSWHYTFTDLIDHVSYKNKTGVIGDKMNDMVTYSYFSMHFDLFSEDKIIRFRKMFEEVKFDDYEMLADEDNDYVVDMLDKCPGTPFNVKVDSLGCPLDEDKDGVFDYMDKELPSRAGAMVNENGVEINTDLLAEKTNVEGINRRDVEMFLLMHKAQSKGARKSNLPIPAKFKTVDTDGDKYISFDELLKSIDSFFDFSSELKATDVYELQDFFFEQ